MKAAAAGLPVGGGKAVIVGDPAQLRSPALWRAYAEVIDLLRRRVLHGRGRGHDGRRHGVAAAAHALRAGPAGRTGRLGRRPLAAHGPRRGGGDPGRVAGGDRPATSAGRASSCRAWGRSAARSRACSRPRARGCGSSDADPVRAAAVAALDRRSAVIAPGGALAHPCDVLVPCAMGGILSPGPSPPSAAAGSWGRPTTSSRTTGRGAALELGIGYVPDFVANAGGLIAVTEQLNGWDGDRVRERVDRIGDAVRELIGRRARRAGRPSRRRWGARTPAWPAGSATVRRVSGRAARR